MIEALRRRLEHEYQKNSDIWVLSVDTSHTGRGRKPIALTDEQIEFITDLFQHELLPWTTVSMLYGYQNGSAGFKRVLDRHQLDYSSDELQARRLAHRQQLTPLVEPKLNKTDGHRWITKYCNMMNWEYMEEWSGWDNNYCKNPKTGKRLRFDVYLPKLNLVVEYHGRQHYSPDNWFHESTANNSNITQEEAYNIYTQRDDYKHQWALNNGLEYLEISHTLFDNDYPLDKIFAPFVNE